MLESPWSVTKRLPECASHHVNGASLMIDREGYLHANGHVSSEPIPKGAVVNIVLKADSVEWQIVDL